MQTDSVLDDILARHSRERPHALALRTVTSGARCDLSYQDLARRTGYAADRLWHAWGVRGGDRVAYLGLNQADQASLAQDRPSLTLQVPATMKALIEHPDWACANLSSLRAVWAGSSTLPEALVAAFHARGVPVCNVYGATETGPFSIALPPKHAFNHVGSCGWPAPGVEVRLAAPAAGTEATVGEVLLRAPNVVARYWPHRPALDAQGWFHSGDLARQAPDGSYTIVGRARDLIISGRENIYPAEIENLLASHPLVAECAVIGQSDAQWGEIAVAVVVLRPQPIQDKNDALSHWEQMLREFLRTRIARYKQPHRWLVLPKLPETAVGKV